MKHLLILMMLAAPAFAQQQSRPATGGAVHCDIRSGHVPGAEARVHSASRRKSAVQLFGGECRSGAHCRTKRDERFSQRSFDRQHFSGPSHSRHRRLRAIMENAKGAPSGGGGNGSQVVPEGVKRVGLPTASSNGAGIGVAIIDTGIDLGNADLLVSTLNSAPFGGSCQDDNGHGTHVSGIVAARDNTIGVLGVAPLATLYCVKVLDSTGSGSDSSM